MGGGTGRRPLAVDVRHLEPDAFHEPQAAGVDRGEAHAEPCVRLGVKDPPHLVAAQHNGELLLAFGARDVEDRPRSPERLLIEELDADRARW